MARWLFSFLLVAIQMGTLALLVLTSGALPRHPVVWLLLIGGLALGVWALFAMRLDRLSAFPDVRANAELVDTGPYRWIRHPMYTALILMGLALALINPIAWRWVLFAILCANQIVKLLYEERMLLDRFPAYRDYMVRTKRLIPLLF